MAIQKAVEFIRNCNRDDIKARLNGISTDNKDQAIQTIVNIGREVGFDFTASEYEQAAQEVAMLLVQERKSIEDVKAEGGDSTNCKCTGCTACLACAGCLLCIGCAWCVIIPFGGEAVIAASSVGAISAAAAVATGPATATATSFQGN